MTELTPAELDAIRARHDVPGVFRLPRREDGLGVQGHRVLMEFDGDLWVVLDANTHHPSVGKITAAAASSFADIPALLSHADALTAKAAHAESRWQKDAMQVDADFDDLREERDEALAKVATLQSLCDSLNAKVARLEGDLEEAIRLLSSGLQVAIGKLPPLPETEPVRALCEKHGYGAVMHMAEFLWFEKDGAGGNHSTGHCYSTIKRFIDRVKGTV